MEVYVTESNSHVMPEEVDLSLNTLVKLWLLTSSAFIAAHLPGGNFTTFLKPSLRHV